MFQGIGYAVGLLLGAELPEVMLFPGSWFLFSCVATILFVFGPKRLVRSKSIRESAVF